MSFLPGSVYIGPMKIPKILESIKIVLKIPAMLFSPFYVVCLDKYA